MKDTKIDEKVLRDIFANIVRHCEWLENEFHQDISKVDFNRYLIGAHYALDAVLDLDSDSYILMVESLVQKLDEYFGGKESE